MIRPSRLAGCLLVGALVPLAIAQGQVASAPLSQARAADDRIAYYERRLAEDPDHYPSLARLGEAYLARARRSHDPADLGRARVALRRSLAIQESYEALRSMAALCNYSHRFEEALDWVGRASKAAPEDRSLLPMRIEALLGLGRLEEAGAQFADPVRVSRDIHASSALGMWQAARGRTDDAVIAFRAAADAARSARADSLAQWALVSAAGARIDAGQAAAASALLEEAERIDPDDILLAIHHAELHELEGQAAVALKSYDALLARDDDPEIHRRAADLARRLGRKEEAARHFEAAKKALTHSIDAGEAYGLETLARLYQEEGGHVEEARGLARHNLEFKRDRSARELARRLKAD